eukprot:1083322-Karenia_brevis.AAC.1
MGRALLKTPDLLSALHDAHENLLRLSQDFKVRPPHMKELAQHVPRADNTAADAAANLALDAGDFHA